MNNKVNFLRGTATEYESSIKDNDTFYYTTDTEKLYLGDKEITGGGVTIDDTLSDTSKNPVQNKVINTALNSKADQTMVDNALAQKANSVDVTASLTGKSDTGHTHDDRYYTESETNALLSDKVGVSNFNSHANSTTVHVTADEKAGWNGKAELTDIPAKVQYVNYLGYISDVENILNNSNYNESAYECIITSTEAAQIGLPSCWWQIKYFRHTDNNGFGIQIAFPIDDSDNLPRYRTSVGLTWDEWKMFSDGGNADMVDNLHITNNYGSKGLVYINEDNGVIEIGNFIDFHSGVSNKNFDIRIQTGATETDEKMYVFNSTNYKATIVANLEGSADTVKTRNEDGSSFGDNWQMTAQFNKNSDNTFRIVCGDGSIWTSVNRSDEATYANSSGITATETNICLRNLSSGTAKADATNCPSGSWYGQHS